MRLLETVRYEARSTLGRWLVLCDGKRVQICEPGLARGSSLRELFDSPLSSGQLCHEMRWHFGIAPVSRDVTENLAALLVHAKCSGRYDSLTIVAPRGIVAMLKYILPQAVQASIREIIEKDLTYCPARALSAYFFEV